MEIKDLKEKLVAVLGYGLEGQATAKYLLKNGVRPVLFDQKAWEEWPESEKEKLRKLGVNIIFGPGAFMELTGFDYIFRSPGVKLSDFKQYSGKAIITSQTKWFFDHCPCKIVGITGTKGKGTTSSLIYEILSADFSSLSPKSSTLRPKVYLTGNIGKVQPFEIIDSLKKDDVVVYELSSFQLQDLEKSPYVSVVLMVTSEHLDYHKDDHEYHEAKASITKFQNKEDFAIVNCDYEASVKIGSYGSAKKIYFSKEDKDNTEIYLENDLVEYPRFNFSFSTKELGLIGKHNTENVMAALGAVKVFEVKNESITKVLKEFRGLEHRLEFVVEKNGIKFYNDSFSTTPETAIAAIKSFTEPIVLVLGGSSKNSDFTELGKALKETYNLKSVILIGQEAERLKKVINGFTGNILEGAKNMEQIFEQIKQVAVSGSVVLLSPACASFGMFRDYKDRGEQFKKLAKEF